MLSKYIRDLLYRYECVIIPEFGGILTKTVSAKIDQESNTFHPPTKRLGFNSQLIENDGLLANHIASVDKIPYENALNFIKFEVAEWNKNLKTQDLSLEQIGVFSLNEDNNIIFKPDQNSNFLTDAFGLSAIEAETVSREDLANKTVVFDSISDVVNQEDVVVNTHGVKREFGSLYKYAAAVAFIFAFGYVGYILFNNNIIEKQIAGLEKNQETRINNQIQKATFKISSKLPDINIKVQNEQEISATDKELTEVDDSSNEDTREKVIIKQDRIDRALANKTETDQTNSSQTNTPETKLDATTKNSIAPVLTKTKPVAEEPLANRNNQKNYHIIAGAFREPANADKKVKQLIAKGYNSQKVGINKWQLTQVSFGSYATKQEAQIALNEIRKSEAKDAWLLVK